MTVVVDLDIIIQHVGYVGGIIQVLVKVMVWHVIIVDKSGMCREIVQTYYKMVVLIKRNHVLNLKEIIGTVKCKEDHKKKVDAIREILDRQVIVKKEAKLVDLKTKGNFFP